MAAPIATDPDWGRLVKGIQRPPPPSLEERLIPLQLAEAVRQVALARPAVGEALIEWWEAREAAMADPADDAAAKRLEAACTRLEQIQWRGDASEKPGGAVMGGAAPYWVE